jgi:hypothetical protein
VFCQPNVKTWRKPPDWDTTTIPNLQFEELDTLVDTLKQIG